MNAPTLVDVGISRGEAGGDGVEFGLDLHDGGVRLETTDNRVGVVATIGEPFWCRNESGPKLGIRGEAKGKLRRHDADDAVWLPIEGDSLAKSRGIRAEAVAPQFVTEDDGATAGLHIGGGESAAVEWANA